ncbi:uncharacterized protein B0T15DRAFT_508956 [Chaetomium strumarium]|uniref:Uncharacterized protein n=1 Tax=Chaetomium strumarium TaxID=1170767 RepID=A0AAJ0GYL0_9PEZI|nr:hypothetical protein B0T15DRAFT_508956 [Chaetomium strumarium]
MVVGGQPVTRARAWVCASVVTDDLPMRLSIGKAVTVVAAWPCRDSPHKIGTGREVAPRDGKRAGGVSRDAETLIRVVRLTRLKASNIYTPSMDVEGRGVEICLIRVCATPDAWETDWYPKGGYPGRSTSPGDGSQATVESRANPNWLRAMRITTYAVPCAVLGGLVVERVALPQDNGMLSLRTKQLRQDQNAYTTLGTLVEEPAMGNPLEPPTNNVEPRFGCTPHVG